MNVEEIKQNITMKDILTRYGIKVKKGFCNCPFHNEKTASMRIYEKSAYCFGCGWGGDVIKFVQQMEGCDFKTAYYSLGGTYDRLSDKEHTLNRNRLNRQRNSQEKLVKAQGDFKKELSFCLGVCRLMIKYLEPFSDEWCFYQNKLPRLVGAWEEKYINGEDVNEINVLGICREVRLQINSIARSYGRTIRDRQ